MADAAMVVEVVTPEQSLLSGPASAIMLRSSDGELTVLPGHTPLVTDVVSGVVRVDREEGGEARLAVHGGFLHVDTGPGAAASAGGVAATGEHSTSGRGSGPTGASGGATGASGAVGGGAEGGPAAGSGGAVGSGTAGPAAPTSTRVTLLAGIAELASEVDVARAEAARAAAEARVNELRAAGAHSPAETGRAGATGADGAGAAAGSSATGGAEGAADEERAADLELAEAEAALARAELRLMVAGD